MQISDVIIIGAGAAGLMAARELTKAGKKVLILEARDRCGGRIHTINDLGFSESVELGAEFIHGDLPVTLNLLKEAGIEVHEGGGEMWEFRNGEFKQGRDFMEGWDLLMEKLGRLENDITIDEFLDKELAGDKYSALRRSVRGFVSGYDSADPDKASAFALRREWLEEDEGAQHRVKGGYGLMIDYLKSEIKKAGGEFKFNTIVKQINWQGGSASIKTTDGQIYNSDKVIVAVPLGVLRADEHELASITFIPPVTDQRAAMDHIGFGSVIKVVLEFKTAFWEHDRPDLGFVLSDEKLPVWWTQTPHRSKVLTGWLSGPPARIYRGLSEKELLQMSLQSISNIFGVDLGELKVELQACKIVNWTKESFTLGSYDYDMLGSTNARKILAEPVADTLFFAGEYAYEGPAMGTVEAALNAGMAAARKVLG